MTGYIQAGLRASLYGGNIVQEALESQRARVMQNSPELLYEQSIIKAAELPHAKANCRFWYIKTILTHPMNAITSLFLPPHDTITNRIDILHYPIGQLKTRHHVGRDGLENCFNKVFLFSLRE